MFDRFIHTFMFLRYAISSGLSLKKAKILKTNVQIKHWNVFISYTAIHRLLKYVPLHALK